MNPMKLILLGVGGYFLIKATGISLPGFGTSTYPNDEGSTSRNGGGETVPPPAAGSTAAPLDETTKTALIKLAASGDAAAAQASKERGILLGADAWNWYREQATGQITTADLFTDPNNRGELIDAPEYLRRRGAAGLAGLAAVVAGVRYGY